MAQTARRVQLKAEILQAFGAYTRDAETAIQQTQHGSRPLLWSDADSDRAKQVRKGDIVAQYWPAQGLVAVPDGLIHDWIGAALVPGATVKKTLALLQDYNHHKNIYRPEVIDSKLISHHGDNCRIYLRLLKKKIITVVLDTYHDVHYSSLHAGRWLCCSYTTQIAEVQGAGSPNEKVLPPDTGHGFLWRLYSYWRLQQGEDGVLVECRAISLTRDVPMMLKWVIQPIIRSLPRESLIYTLQATRQALLGT
jgi:hypothetical protein